jgi:hypothetical protein
MNNSDTVLPPFLAASRYHRRTDPHLGSDHETIAFVDAAGAVAAGKDSEVRQHAHPIAILNFLQRCDCPALPRLPWRNDRWYLSAGSVEIS